MKRHIASFAGIIIAVAGLTGVVGGQKPSPDWPQWRGPNRDGTLATFAEPKAWPDQLTQRWKIEVGTGYATPIVVGNRVFAFSRQQDNEVMRAIDADSGKIAVGDELSGAVHDEPGTARHGPDRNRRRPTRTAGSSRSASAASSPPSTRPPANSCGRNLPRRWSRCFTPHSRRWSTAVW